MEHLRWQRDRREVPQLEASGLGGMVARPAEPLSEAACVCLHAWEFCGGWAPERLPAYATFFDVDDWDLLIAGLLTLRNLRNQDDHEI